MALIEDNIEGRLEVRGLPDDYCFTSATDLIKALAKYLVPYLPANALSGFVIGKSPPPETSKKSIWIRFDSQWNFVGFYAFQTTTWEPLYLIAPNQILWMYGNSEQVPKGFKLVDSENTVVPADVISAILPLYYPAGNGPYKYFAVTYVGY